MRVWVHAAALLCVAAAAAEAAAAGDRDFEFEDNQQESVSQQWTRQTRRAAPLAPGAPAVLPRGPRTRRYVYDPNNELCAAVSCGPRAACVVSVGGGAGGGGVGARARCVPRARLRADTMSEGESESEDNSLSEEDVFYEASADLDQGAAGGVAGGGAAHCVGCGAEAEAEGGGFLCGSDNRTYSSLCRLDLHNCVRRPRPPVALACRGFCPCAAPRATPRPPRRLVQRRKHDKFRQYTHEAARRRRLEANHNEVLPGKGRARPRLRLEPAVAIDGGGEAAACSLESMASRLLDWFAVLMEQAGRVSQTPHSPHLQATLPRDNGDDDEFPAWCPREVRWMFSHLDSDGDGVLSADNLYALQHDESERCLRPFLASCGAGGGAGDGARRGAWCRCLRRGARPCARLARAHPHPPPGEYVPRCDAAGWYLPRQCHGALRQCWCVDRRGIERPGSRARGLVRCDTTSPSTSPPLRAESELEEVAQRKQEIALNEDIAGVEAGVEVETGAGQGAPADDEDGAAGSGAGASLGDLLY